MSLINWKLPVADKEVFWDTLKTYKGWKFQHNKVIGQYRVVSPGKYREAWGFDREEILADFKRLSDYNSENNQKTAPLNKEQPKEYSTVSKLELYNELEKVTELYEKAILTESEFQQERKNIMDKISKLQ